LWKATGDIDIDKMRIETDECRAPHLGKHENIAFPFWTAAKLRDYRKSLSGFQ